MCSYFLFKQKTAYEMRISDWSSDVCSSDLALIRQILGDLLDTHTGAPLAGSGRAIGVDGAKVSVDLQLGYPAGGAIDAMTARVRQALEADPAIDSAAVSITSRIHVHKVQGTLGRSEARRVGKECVSAGRSRWRPYP